MPDKLTDAEIKKALNVCVGMQNDCGDCPLLEYSKASEECMNELMSNALNLINRLQAEKEELKIEVDFLRATKNLNQSEFEELKIKLELKEVMLKLAKAEAYKECIEKVKETSDKTELVCSGALVRTDYTITEKKLDNLARELVGEK